MITEKLVRTALEKLTSPAAFDYFFDNLKSADWIRPLEAVNAKLLVTPPEPEKTEVGTSFPGWAVSKYLARVAEQSPDIVLDVIKRSKPTTNFRVHEDYLDAALKMPPEHAIEIARMARKWVEGGFFFFLPQKCADLALKLAKAGKQKEALQLFSAIIQPVAPEPNRDDSEETTFRSAKAHARFRDWDFDRILEKQFLELADLLGIPAISVAVSALRNALRIERRLDDEYLASHWRAAIEDHNQNMVEDIKDHLIVAIRDAYVAYLRKNPAKINEVFEGLTTSDLTILKRLGYFLAGHADVGSSHLVARVLLNKDNLDNTETWHEVAALIRERFSILDPQNREAFIKLVIEAPIDPYSDDPSKDKKLWQLRVLSLIDSQVPNELSELYASLRSEFGSMDHPDFHSYHSGVWHGPTSPISAADLSQKTAVQIAEYLRTWQPTSDWFSPSREGLARQLVEVVKEKPAEILSLDDSLHSLHPTYCRVIIEGLSGTNHPFDWGAALNFFEWIISQGIQEHPGNKEDEDTSFAWARVSIIRLFEKAFNAEKNRLPFSERTRVWQIIEPVTRDPHPTAESEAKYLNDRTDYYQHSINTARGTALECVAQYALWVRRESGIKGDEPSLDLVPEVKQVFEDHLDIQKDAQFSIRSMYGRWLPWLALLSPEWTKELLPRIFPGQADLRRYRESAWFTYLQFCGVYDSVFQLLKPFYITAIQELSSLGEEFKPESSHEPELRLSEHLMIAYARGLVDVATIENFFRAAPKRIRAHAIDFCGRSLRDDAPQEIKDRLKTLWELRAKRPAFEVGTELKEFGWWVLSNAFDLDWSLEQLAKATQLAGAIEPDSLLFENLAKKVEAAPYRILAFAEAYVAGPLKQSSGWFHEEDFRKLLTLLKQHLDASGKERLKALLNRLGAAGYFNFRELLKGL